MADDQINLISYADVQRLPLSHSLQSYLLPLVGRRPPVDEPTRRSSPEDPCRHDRHSWIGVIRVFWYFIKSEVGTLMAGAHGCNECNEACNE